VSNVKFECNFLKLADSIAGVVCSILMLLAVLTAQKNLMLLCTPFTSLIPTAAEVVLLVAALGVCWNKNSLWKMKTHVLLCAAASSQPALGDQRLKSRNWVNCRTHLGTESAEKLWNGKAAPRAQQQHNRTIDRLHEARARERLWIFILLLVQPGCCFALARNILLDGKSCRCLRMRNMYARWRA